MYNCLLNRHYSQAHMMFCWCLFVRTHPSRYVYMYPKHLQKGLRPHNYCLPILKRERHREAVAAAATSGSKKFFLGTDRWASSS